MWDLFSSNDLALADVSTQKATPSAYPASWNAYCYFRMTTWSGISQSIWNWLRIEQRLIVDSMTFRIEYKQARLAQSISTLLLKIDRHAYKTVSATCEMVSCFFPTILLLRNTVLTARCNSYSVGTTVSWEITAFILCLSSTRCRGRDRLRRVEAILRIRNHKMKEHTNPVIF